MNQAEIAALLYLAAGSLFILALKGLSSPATSRAGNRNGIIGMVIAVLTTLWVSGVADPLTWALVIGGLSIGGGIGALMAKKIAMTDMPQLVAAFHSLVGLAAVLTGITPLPHSMPAPSPSPRESSSWKSCASAGVAISWR